MVTKSAVGQGATLLENRALSVGRFPLANNTRICPGFRTMTVNPSSFGRIGFHSLLIGIGLSTALAMANPLAPLLEKLPASEKPVFLFNGKDLGGWDGAAGIWSVVDGEIVGANKDPVASSTYLFTKDSHREFRLLLEVKQTMSPAHSTMHSAVAALGERIEDKGDNKHGFKGPLLMFCHDWGIWDAYGRNRVEPAGQNGPLSDYAPEKKGDWNLIEILVIGNRIRFVANGTLVFDFTDVPDKLRTGPLGLQIHSNAKPQEFRFRGLILSTTPSNQLVTLLEAKKEP